MMSGRSCQSPWRSSLPQSHSSFLLHCSWDMSNWIKHVRLMWELVKMTLTALQMGSIAKNMRGWLSVRRHGLAGQQHRWHPSAVASPLCNRLLASSPWLSLKQFPLSCQEFPQASPRNCLIFLQLCFYRRLLGLFQSLLIQNLPWTRLAMHCPSSIRESSKWL